MPCFWWDDLERWGARIALSDQDGREISYRDLASSADSYAQHFGEDRQLVLLESSNSIAAIIALIACLRARHPVILSSDIGVSRIVENFRPNIVVDAIGGLNRHNATPHTLHKDLALMLSTSGSTGAAKLVRLSYEALHANATSIADYLGITDEDVPITTLPIAYSYGLSVISSHLLAGARIVLTDRSVIDEDFWTLFTAQRVTSMAGVPYTYELLETCGFRRRETSSLRTLTQAGGRMDAHLRDQYGAWAAKRGIRFFVMYGQTEATARIAYLPPELQAEFGDCIGRAVPGGKLHVEDAEGLRLPSGERGELVYQGPNVMMGYANDPTDLAAGHDIEALHTGDLGQEVADGIFRIVGRLSRFSKIAGLRIGLDEIEKLLAEHGIRATVCGDDEAIAVCLDDDALSARSASLLDINMAIPSRALVFLAPDILPRLSSGKPDSPAILHMAKTAKAERDAVREGAGSHDLALLYGRALNRSEIAQDQSFATLGGDSLGYIEVAMGIEQRLGYLPDHWETLSIAQIEQMGAGNPQTAPSRFVTVETEMLMRPIAMTTIVVGHVMAAISSLQPMATSWRGGALALLMMAGYNICRFQKGTLLSEKRFQVVTNFGRRILLPFYLLVLVKCVQWLYGGPYVAWSSFALLDDYVRYPDSANLLAYWFIGLLFQCVLILTALFYIRRLRSFAQGSGFYFALSLLAAAYAVKVIVYISLLPEGALVFPNTQLDYWAYAFALGWMVAEARTVIQRLSCIVLGIVASSIDWGLLELHTIMLTGAILLILYIPRVRLPSVVNAPLALWARATFFIYLTHGFAKSVARVLNLRALLGGSDVALVVATVILATVSGIAFYLLWRKGEHMMASLRQLLLRQWRSSGTNEERATV